jgi:CheY-like chemotaxis protein
VGGALCIRVADTGIGIPEAILPRIFELFAQAENAGRVRQSGLGIGLALARRLAEMHGGTLVAKSDGADRGSEFSLRVPLAARQQAVHQPASESHYSLGGIRVAVIDDNRDAADIMGMLIEEQGGSVRVAYDGTSGIAAAREFRPDVLLLDIGMPDMDGYEVCRRLRVELGTELRIIALTGWGQDQDKRSAFQSGCDAHLTKPADPQQLADTIRSLMKKSS